MFIKKDLRKIPTILDEAVDCSAFDDENHSDDENNYHNNANSRQKKQKREEPLKILKLGRRKQEFEGCVKVLCSPSHVPKLTHLSVLNLYDCDIHDLAGFGPMFGAAAPSLETLNLGRNPIEGIPDEFSEVKSLKHLWLDDCKLTGKLPRALLDLPNIESLRIPNNNLTHMGIGDDGEEFEFDNQEASMMVPLTKLKLLCLDKNQLSELPSNLAEWAPNLQELFLRHNRFETLGVQQWPESLQILHVSSNRLRSLVVIPSLTHLYANGNQLEKLPKGILKDHPSLKRLVVSHNPPLTDLPADVWKKVLQQQPDGEESSSSCEILWQPNPNLRAPAASGNETTAEEPMEE